MKIELFIPDFSPSVGIRTEWEEEYVLKSEVTEYGEIRIFGNQNGLISLARHLLTLAQPAIPSGYHLHYDTWNSLDEGSRDIIIEKI